MKSNDIITTEKDILKDNYAIKKAELDSESDEDKSLLKKTVDTVKRFKDSKKLARIE
jgi:hypothetical protein